jgi:hypothetical protein
MRFFCCIFAVAFGKGLAQIAPCAIKATPASALRKTVTTFDAFSGEKNTRIICGTIDKRKAGEQPTAIKKGQQSLQPKP